MNTNDLYQQCDRCCRMFLKGTMCPTCMGQSVSAMPAPSAWVCPKCGNVYAPFVAECYRCNSTVSVAAEQDAFLESEKKRHAIYASVRRPNVSTPTGGRA